MPNKPTDVRTFDDVRNIVRRDLNGDPCFIPVSDGYIRPSQVEAYRKNPDGTVILFADGHKFRHRPDDPRSLGSLLPDALPSARNLRDDYEPASSEYDVGYWKTVVSVDTKPGLIPLPLGYEYEIRTWAVTPLFMSSEFEVQFSSCFIPVEDWTPTHGTDTILIDTAVSQSAGLNHKIPETSIVSPPTYRVMRNQPVNLEIDTIGTDGTYEVTVTGRRVAI